MKSTYKLYHTVCHPSIAYTSDPTFPEFLLPINRYMTGIPMKKSKRFGQSYMKSTMHYTYGTYMNGNFNTCMGKLKMKHLPHDGRHTFASLMDSTGANDVCIKLIMGHSMRNDTTKDVYTHKTLKELLTEVNKI